jgi:hypothetical protein
MHVGFGTFFQNLGHERPDREFWQTETELAGAREPGAVRRGGDAGVASDRRR